MRINILFYFFFFSSLILFVQFFIWKIDIVIALMTKGTMGVLLTIPLAFPKNSSTEICGNFMLPSHQPSKGPFSFQLHPLYNPLLLNVKKIRRERITLFSYFSDFYYYSLSGEKESHSFPIFLTLITKFQHVFFLSTYYD